MNEESWHRLLEYDDENAVRFGPSGVSPTSYFLVLMSFQNVTVLKKGDGTATRGRTVRALSRRAGRQRTVHLPIEEQLCTV